jgi:hypothetical protein
MLPPASADLAERTQRRLLAEWVPSLPLPPQAVRIPIYRREQREVLHALEHLWVSSFPAVVERLRQGDPGFFFEALTFAPSLLLEPEIYNLTIGLWWKQKFFRGSEGEQARSYLHKVGSILANSLGTTELPEEERKKKNRQRQENFRTNDRAAEAALREDIEQAVKKLPASVLRDEKKCRSERAKIEDWSIRAALTSADPHRRKAAEKFKKQRLGEHRQNRRGV